jgi:hypothetical protein
MSIFNERMICLACVAIEQAYPRFDAAGAAEVAAERRADLDFPRIGMPEDLMPPRGEEADEARRGRTWISMRQRNWRKVSLAGVAKIAFPSSFEPNERSLSPGVDDHASFSSPGMPELPSRFPAFVTTSWRRRFVGSSSTSDRVVAELPPPRFGLSRSDASLQVFRFGRMQMYRVKDFFAAHEHSPAPAQSGCRRRGSHLG